VTRHRCQCRGHSQHAGRLPKVSIFTVFAILLVIGVAVLGIAALAMLVLLLVRGRAATRDGVES
jgi:hypothetical protein